MFEIIKRHNKSRMLGWLLVTLILLAVVTVLGPEGGWSNVLLAGWKLCLVTGAAYAGYWIDRYLSPYGRPDDWLEDSRVFAACQLRRAIIVAACIIGLGMAL